MDSREQTRQNYDRLFRWYDLFADSEAKFTETGLGMLDVKAGEHVLEIGFGTGHALISIARQAGDAGLAVGVELSPGMIAVARKRIYPFGHKQAGGPERGVRIMRGDGVWLPFLSGLFDAVFLSFTLELFLDVEIPLVLSECRRVLKKNGRLGVVSMTKQDTFACRLYEWGHGRWPALLDCRPIYVIKDLEAGGFCVQTARVRTMWGLPVGIVLARPVSLHKEF